MIFRNHLLNILLFSLALILATPLSSQAHRVNIFAWVEGGTIMGECSYPSGEPVQNSEIVVSNAASEEQLLTLSSDAEGLFSFPIPQAAIDQGCDLLLALNAGMGHRNTWTVTAGEILPGQDAQVPAVDTTEPATPEAVDRPAAVMMSDLNMEDMEALLNRELSPIRKELAELRQAGSSFQNIAGGIGYLVGIFGLLAWFKSRPAGSKA